VDDIMPDRNRPAHVTEFIREHDTKNYFIHGTNFPKIMPSDSV
jgi:hypothetical protein